MWPDRVNTHTHMHTLTIHAHTQKTEELTAGASKSSVNVREIRELDSVHVNTGIHILTQISCDDDPPHPLAPGLLP